jgi:hypothetical protein
MKINNLAQYLRIASHRIKKLHLTTLNNKAAKPLLNDILIPCG